MLRRKWWKLAARLGVMLAVAVALGGRAGAQDWFKTGTGLGVQKVRVAVPEFGAADSQAQALEKTFHDVLAADLDYSGILEMVSPSFYPATKVGAPGELKAGDWSTPPPNASMVAFGNLKVSGTNLAASGWLDDVKNAGAPAVVEKIYRGAATEMDARRLAHQFADDIVARLGGGVAGVASTRIAYVSSRSGNKEIWVMDYDGANPHQESHLRTISLTPRWSPDATKIAFTCFVPVRGVISAQICLLSVETGGMLAFPRYRGTNGTPAWSPDGSKIAFMSSQGGAPNLYVGEVNGGRMQRLTSSRAVDTSPDWNPKTGQQIVFVSDRAGDPVLYMINSDGTNVQRLDMGDKGYVVDPSWSPNGQLLAFSWRRPSGNFDIYVMDIASHQIAELTRDAGRNERPSWAPDGRHIVFESTRTGTRQIWTMLADGSQPRQLTTGAENASPSWSSK